MYPFLIDKSWKYAQVLVSGTPLNVSAMALPAGTTELITEPIRLVDPQGSSPIDALGVEISGSYMGADLGTALAKAVLNLYRCPGAIRSARDAVALYTENHLLSTAAAQSAEKVTNGDFAVATGWVQGQGWTIAAGVATHAAEQHVVEGEPLSRAITLVADTAYLMKADLSSAGDLDSEVSFFIGQDRIANAAYAIVPEGTAELKQTTQVYALLPTAAWMIRTPQAFTAANTIKVAANNSSQDLILDNFSIRSQTPYNFSHVRRVDDNLGDAFCIGIKPDAAVDLADTFVRIRYRRWKLAY